MSDTAAIRRQLKIKSGSAKRLYKEHRSYQREEEDLKRKLDGFRASGAEDWDINNARRMMEESAKMVTDTASRLGVIVQELREIILSAEKDPALAEDEDMMKAKETLEEVSI
ncbi:Tubulin-specific chaperone A [Grifola frondosa]|uniref:Tubulin-specific chaperone A n=1 Tax=Grifola frondosa TaxID=5627 RepID=A0A1C7LUK3_GRIFR|nr:Tubulin-specific chaperone A [Grifola frondosa]